MLGDAANFMGARSQAGGDISTTAHRRWLQQTRDLLEAVMTSDVQATRELVGNAFVGAAGRHAVMNSLLRLLGDGEVLPAWSLRVLVDVALTDRLWSDEQWLRFLGLLMPTIEVLEDLHERSAHVRIALAVMRALGDLVMIEPMPIMLPIAAFASDEDWSMMCSYARQRGFYFRPVIENHLRSLVEDLRADYGDDLANKAYTRMRGR